MSRYLVLLVLYFVFSLPCAAQAPADTSSSPAPNNADQSYRDTLRTRSPRPASTAVSVSRLRVPRKARQFFEKAMAAWKNDNVPDAQDKLQQALKIDASFPEALALCGYLHSSLQQWDSAEQKLQAAIRSDPNYSASYIVLAGIYNTQGRFDEAQEAAQRALSTGANATAVQYEFARVLVGKAQYEDALALSEQALRSQHLTLMHVARAHALLGLGRYLEAATELRTYLRYQPSGEGSQDAHFLLERLNK